jgi:predicted dehydrogenase
MNALVIGNGSAGKRHARMLQQIGLDVTTADPYAPADYVSWIEAMHAQKWDYAVIASPPKEHLAQLWSCIAQGVPVLCEKPLCTNEQYHAATSLPRDAKVMVAYNWLYNKDVKNFAKDVINYRPNGFGMLAEQVRVLPEWGLLLDHVSHDISILDTVTGGIESITAAHYSEDDVYKCWAVLGTSKSGKFSLTERVYAPPENVLRVMVSTILILTKH